MIDKFLDVAENELKDFIPRGFTNMEIAIIFINFLTIVFFLIPIKFIEINSELVEYYNLIWEPKWIVLWLIIMTIFEGIYLLLNRYRDDFGLLDIYRIKNLISRFFCFYMSVYFLIGVFIIKSEYIKDINISFSNILILIVILFSFIIVLGNFIDMIKQLFKKDDSFQEYKNKKAYMNYIINKYKQEDNETIEKQLLLCQLYEITSTLYDKNVLLDKTNFEAYKKMEMYKKRNELNKKFSDKIY